MSRGRVVTSQPRTATSVELSEKARADMEFRFYLRGLEDLYKADFVHIEQQMPIDLKAGCGAGNTYHVKNKSGDKIFYAVEDDNCFCRWCCGPYRMFHITILNNQDEPVLHLDRACCRCDWCCCVACCMCQHHLVIRDRRGQILGYARQRFHIFNHRMDVMDHNKETFAKVHGPCCVCRCCTDINFDILNKYGDQEEGYIYKRWGGRKEYVNMDHENFEIQYPAGTNVQRKAVLLGAAFLVGFMYFEMS